MSYFAEHDESAWPIVYGRFAGVGTVTGFEAFVSWHTGVMHKAMAQKQRLVVVTDARAVTGTPPDVRAVVGKWISDSPREFEEMTLESVVVLQSALMRGVLTAVGWLSTRKVRLTVFATLPEAWESGVAALKRIGQEPPKLRPPWAM